MYEYNANFYSYINQGAIESARKVLPQVQALVVSPVDSVLDVGCGAGAWLSVWKEGGASVIGLDGDYVDINSLLIDVGEFVPADLTAGFSLDRRFALVQCLEVAEHLPEASAVKLVESLCQHSDVVVFSAAPPGQGGENHINEKPYEYWRHIFQSQGYAMYDAVRPGLLGEKSVKPWYRYNIFIFLSGQCDPGLRAALSPYLVSEGSPVADVSPPLYQLRKRVIRLLPPFALTALAIIKKQSFIISQRVHSAQR
jgi:SAM-dependent methyltransferase